MKRQEIYQFYIFLFIFFTATALCFHEFSYSGTIYFSFPDKELLVAVFFLPFLHFLFAGNFFLDRYEFKYILFVSYAVVLTLVKFPEIPALTDPDRIIENKFVFLFFYNLIFFLIIGFNHIVKHAARRKIDPAKILFESFFLYTLIGLMLYFLSFAGLNPLKIGVSATYGFPRLQGLMPEPSFLTIQVVTSFIYFREKGSWFKCYISLLAVLLTFSSTAFLLLGMYICFVLIEKRKIILIVGILGLMISSFFLINLFFPQMFAPGGILYFLVGRIVGSLKTAVLNFHDLLNGSVTYKNYFYSPRVKTFFNNIFFMIKRGNLFFGNGFGSQVFFLKNFHASIVSFVLSHIFEIGLVGFMLQLSLFKTTLTRSNALAVKIMLIILVYWFINSQVFFISFYIIGAVLYFSPENKSGSFMKNQGVSFENSC